MAIGSGRFVESLDSAEAAVFAASSRSLATSTLPLVDKLALASITEVALHIILHILHLRHLCCNLRYVILTESALIGLDALFHLLGFQIVDEVGVVEPLSVVLVHVAVEGAARNKRLDTSRLYSTGIMFLP